MPPESFGEIPNYDTLLDIFSYAGIVLHVVNHEWPSHTNQVIQDPLTGKLTTLSEVEHRQAHVDEMKGRAEVLKPLVNACLHNCPSKRPPIAAIFKLLELLKVSVSANIMHGKIKIALVCYNYKHTYNVYIKSFYCSIHNVLLFSWLKE